MNSIQQHVSRLESPGYEGHSLANLCRGVGAPGLRSQFRVPFDKTLRFADPAINDDGILLLELKTARPYFHGGRVGAFQKERRDPLPSQNREQRL